mmetsp:Transcript_85193/g.227746  ORF Transcript_85193/g.227746 Transcript_85193/m.227746 type:complete len:438 (+) Transcript_85193:748-2061(+)
MQLIQVRGQLIHLRGLPIPRLLVRGQLRVTPPSVLGLLVRLLLELDDQVPNQPLHLQEGTGACGGGDLGEDAAAEAAGGLLEVRGGLVLRWVAGDAPQLQQRLAITQLHQGRQVTLCRPGHSVPREDPHGLLDRINLVRSGLLPALVVNGLVHALGVEVREVLGVRRKVGLLFVLLSLCLRHPLLLVTLLCRLSGTGFRSGLDLILQRLDHHLVVVLLIQLLLLEVTQLGPELVFQVLQHVNDPTGMALVSRSFRGLHPRPDGIRLLLQESHDPLLRGHGQESLGGHSNLQQGVLRLGLAVHLLQGRDRSADCVQALAVVRVGRRVVRRLLTPHLRTSLLVNFVRLHLLVKRGDLLAQNPDISVQLADLRLQGSNHLLGLLDRMRLDIVGCTAPLLELGKANLFILLLLLALGKHALQELYNFRGGRHTCRRRTQSQ